MPSCIRFERPAAPPALRFCPLSSTAAMSKATQPPRFQSAQCFSRCSVARTAAAKSAPLGAVAASRSLARASISSILVRCAARSLSWLAVRVRVRGEGEGEGEG